VLRSKLGLVQV